MTWDRPAEPARKKGGMDIYWTTKNGTGNSVKAATLAMYIAHQESRLPRSYCIMQYTGIMNQSAGIHPVTIFSRGARFLHVPQ